MIEQIIEPGATSRLKPSNMSTATKVWYFVLLLLVALGAYSILRQELYGHKATNLTNLGPWGLYISGFLFFVGASAGSTLIGLMVHAFKREDYAPLATRAILVGLFSLGMSVAMIMMDVGRIDRAIFIPWLHRNFTSMFFYTSLSYQIFAVLLLAELYYTIKITRGVATDKDKQRGKWVSIAAVPFALVALHAVSGTLFAVIKAREFLNNSLAPPHFIVVALLSGIALMMIVAVVTNWLRRKENKAEVVSERTLRHMGILLAFFLVTAMLMDFFDFIVFSYGDLPASDAAWELLSGQNLPFSIIHVGGYVITVLILISPRRHDVRWLTGAAAVVLLAVAAYRYNLVAVDMSVPLLPFFKPIHYFPSFTEWTIVLGVASLMTLAYSVATQILPMEERIGDGSAGAEKSAGAREEWSASPGEQPAT